MRTKVIGQLYPLQADEGGAENAIERSARGYPARSTINQTHVYCRCVLACGGDYNEGDWID